MTETTRAGLDRVSQALDRGLGAGGFEAAAPGDAVDQALRAALIATRARLASLPTHNVFGSEDDALLSQLQSWLAEQGPALGASLEAAPSGGYEAQFDNLDPRWLWEFRDHWWKKRERHAFVVPGEPEAIANDYHIALLSDWGTGLFGAPVCARSIEAEAAAPDLVLHLGDVYYTGNDAEMRQRFLEHWPTVPGAIHRALNGNHEMYSGGMAYFDTLLSDPRFAQHGSCFAQHNDDWLLIHLDTAYDEHDLHGGQAEWALSLARRFADHRLMLFSHHQPFSAFEKQGPKLQHKLAPLLATKRVAAWYWGHEHLCARYELHPGWQMHGRCIGHSGFPYFRFLANGWPVKAGWYQFDSADYVPGGVVLDGPNPYVKGHEDSYGPNGYVTVELKGRAVHERYLAADGAVLDEFDIGADR